MWLVFADVKLTWLKQLLYFDHKVKGEASACTAEMTSELLSAGLDKSLLSEELRITPEGIQWVQKCLNAIEERSKQFQSKGMTKFNFVFGVSNSLIVAWSFGALPGYFWIVYIVEALILLPIRWNNMIKRLPKEHLYWLDFCWCANFVGVILLMALLFKDFDLHVQKWAFCAAWGLGNGPLLCAIAVLGNSLLFHDFDNTSSVLIHLFPSLVMYEMGWNREDVFEAFPNIFTYHFFNGIRLWEDIYYNAAVSYMAWWLPYAGWLLTIGMTAPKRGYDTIFHHTMRGAGGTVVSKLLGFSPEEQKEMARGNSFTRGALLHSCGVAMLFLQEDSHRSSWLHGPGNDLQRFLSLYVLHGLQLWAGAETGAEYPFETRRLCSHRILSHG